MAKEITEEGKQQQQELLDEINEKIEAKQAEIDVKQAEIDDLEAQLDEENPDSYAAQIAAVVRPLSLNSYFTEAELKVLQPYFIEQDMTEETFVASDLSSSSSSSSSVGSIYDIAGASVSVSDAAIVKIDLTEQFAKSVYTLAGGTVSIAGEFSLSADIVRGTLETTAQGSFVLSIYAGTITAGDTSAPSGLITISGELSSYTDDVQTVAEDEITSLEGTTLSFIIVSGSLFLTQNAGDYQKYSVQMELLEYAEGVLEDAAFPSYEFEINSGNFIFAREFAPFREKLRLGDALYLRLQNG